MMQRLLQRLGLWCLHRSRTETVVCCLEHEPETPRVVVAVLVADAAVPGLIYGALYTYCQVHQIDVPAMAVGTAPDQVVH
jgi:hypothetical protein